MATNQTTNYRDADGQEVQPRFYAFMLDRGATRLSDVSGPRVLADFMSWLSARWSEFDKLHGIPSREARSFQQHSFDAWLQGCVVVAEVA
ncbi:hypothetical protein V5G24_04345 [Xanthobacter sp. VTT E-85241]|uniref:hypothetical protein n=1 Tax=Roseixanthobacter finlandensis TaxID=3119922 RepID=UPI00372AAF74